MLDAKAFANAVTIVAAVFYVACVLVSYLFPDFLFSMAQSWVHSLSLNALKTNSSISFMSTVWGLITLSALSWVTTYATIQLYNRLKK